MSLNFFTKAPKTGPLLYDIKKTDTIVLPYSEILTLRHGKIFE